MRTAYRILADAIMVLVVVQAMMMVWAIAGLFNWIDDGATLDSGVIKSWEDDPPTFDGAIGVLIHGMSGMFLIPLLALILLIISFFARVPRGTTWALVVFVSVLVQVTLGISAEGLPFLGALHGLNAFVLFTSAFMAMRASKAVDVRDDRPAPAHV